MKKLITISLMLFSLASYSQIRPLKFLGDTIQLLSNGANGATLQIKSKTKDSIGFLFNKGNGVTEFRRVAVRLNPSQVVFGKDTLNVPETAGASNTYSIGPNYNNTQVIFYQNSAPIDSVEFPYTRIIPGDGFFIKDTTVDGHPAKIFSVLVSDGSNSNSSNRGIGGYVTWSGVGLKFYISPAQYIINDSFYVTGQDSVTLSPADATNPRVDNIVLNTNRRAAIDTGVASMNPVFPQELQTEWKRTSVQVNAGATTPSNITQKYLYREHTEWVLGALSGLTANLDGGTAFEGSKAIDVSFSNNDPFFYLSYSPSPLDASPYSVLNLRIRLKTAFTGKNFYIVWRSSVVNISTQLRMVAAYGFDPTLVGVYQNITIPMSDFKITDNNLTSMRFYFPGGASSGGCFIDAVNLQGGITTGPISGLKRLAPSPFGLTKATDSSYIADSSQLATRARLANELALKLNKTDTSFLHGKTIVFFGKNATKDSSIILLSDGTRLAAKDSIGTSGGGSGSGKVRAGQNLTNVDDTTLRIADKVALVDTAKALRGLSVYAGAEFKGDTTSTRKVFLVYGPSIDAGLNATTPPQRWTRIFANKMHWKEDNRAVSSTKFQKTTGGDQSFVDLYPSIPNYHDSIGAILIGTYQINQVSVGSYPVYMADLSRYIDSLIINKHYPPSLIFVSGSAYTGATIRGAGTLDSLNKLNDSTRKVSNAHGTQFIDFFNGMKKGGSDKLVAPDSTHPNDDGHWDMADIALSTVKSSGVRVDSGLYVNNEFYSADKAFFAGWVSFLQQGGNIRGTMDWGPFNLTQDLQYWSNYGPGAANKSGVGIDGTTGNLCFSSRTGTAMVFGNGYGPKGTTTTNGAAYIPAGGLNNFIIVNRLGFGTNTAPGNYIDIQTPNPGGGITINQTNAANGGGYSYSANGVSGGLFAYGSSFFLPQFANRVQLSSTGPINLLTGGGSASGDASPLYIYAGGYTTAAEIARFTNTGIYFSFGSGATPSALLHLAAGASGAGKAFLKLTAGSLLTTPESGAVEYTSAGLYLTVGSTRYSLTKTLIGTAAPATTPLAVGDHFIDTTNKKEYVATGTSSSADWTILN